MAFLQLNASNIFSPCGAGVMVAHETAVKGNARVDLFFLHPCVLLKTKLIEERVYPWELYDLRSKQSEIFRLAISETHSYPREPGRVHYRYAVEECIVAHNSLLQQLFLSHQPHVHGVRQGSWGQR